MKRLFPIVDRSTEGAKYAKHKDKRSNQDLEFYWLPLSSPTGPSRRINPLTGKPVQDVPKAQDVRPDHGTHSVDARAKREYLNARFGTTDFRKLSLADQETVAAL